MRTEHENKAEKSRKSGRVKMVLAMALATTGLAQVARADSAIGVNSAAGAQINPRGQFPTTTGQLSNFWENSRSPSGLLYPRPPLLPDMTQSSSNPDWWSSGWAEVGYIGSSGKTGTASFREYGDWSNGPMVTSAGFLAENRKTATYLSANVGNVARDDQYYQANFGTYGLFNTTLTFDSIPHVFSTNSEILWNGAGTARLSLPATLTPGASTAARVQAAFDQVKPSEVSLKREKAGFAVNYTPSEEYEVFFKFGNEWRKGERGLGATFGMPNRSGATEIIEPINYRTVDINGGLRYKGEEIQANITYAGSFFSNENDALIWENPGLSSNAAGSFIPTQGRMALAPSNSYNTINGDFAWAFNPKSRFAANASYASMRQNEDLLPPTISSGTIRGVATTINLSNWNTVAALSQKTAGAKINTYNLFAQYEYNPIPELRLDLEMRARGEDNKTDYTALNPLTGQYGYIALDGGLAPGNARLNGVYEPAVAGSLVQIRNVPYARDNFDLTAKGAYRLENRDRIQVAFTRKAIHNSYREVIDSVDNRVSTQYSTRARDWGTIRLTYEYAKLNGDDYVSYPYGRFDTFSLPGYIPRFTNGDLPFTLSEMRKFDVADRSEHVVKAQTNFIVSEKIDFQLTGDYKNDNYEGDYGLRGAKIFDFNAEGNYQVSLNTTLNAFYSYQRRKRDVSYIRSGTATADAFAGSSTYPLTNAWTEAADDKSHVFGVGAHHKIDNVTLDVNYTYMRSNGGLGYTYAGPGAINAALTAAQAGTAFPDTKFRDQVLETSLLWNYTAKVAVRAYYRMEREKLEDFHYTGLTSNVINLNTYLDAVPENYTAHIIGLFFQYSY